jgi:hypothetical protein
MSSTVCGSITRLLLQFSKIWEIYHVLGSLVFIGKRTCLVLVRLGSPCLPSGTTHSTILPRSRATKSTYELLLLVSRPMEVECDLRTRQVSQSESRKYKMLMREFMEP